MSDKGSHQEIARWYEKFAERTQQLAAVYVYPGLFLKLAQRRLRVVFAGLKLPTRDAHLAAVHSAAVGALHQYGSPFSRLRKQKEQDGALALLGRG
jgi:hypothetical protein